MLRAVGRRGLLTPEDAQAMAAQEHGGGFPVDAAVRIEAHERDGLERLQPKRDSGDLKSRKAQVLYRRPF